MLVEIVMQGLDESLAQLVASTFRATAVAWLEAIRREMIALAYFLLIFA